VTSEALAVLLVAAWVIVQNPATGGSDVPMSSWKKLGEYDASWLCAQNLILLLAERPWLEGAYLAGDIRCERAARLQPEEPGPPQPAQ